MSRRGAARTKVGWFVACGLAFLAEPRDARAAPRGLELVWSAPEGCPTEAEVLAAVEQLLGPNAELERPLGAVARVEGRGDGFRLTLGLSTATASAVRTVDGATCAEVMQAAAVIVALAADPATNIESLANAAPTPPPLAPAPPAAPSTKTPPSPPPEAAAPLPERGDVDRRPGVHAGAALDFGSLPSASPGVLIGGELPVPPISLVLDALTFLPMDEVIPEGAGTFWLSALSLRPCFRVPVSGIVFAPCAAAELHLMFGEGERVDFPTERWTLYVRLGAGLEARFPISSQFEVLAGGYGLVAPSRPTFVIGTGTPVHQPAILAGRLTLGFGLKL